MIYGIDLLKFFSRRCDYCLLCLGSSMRPPPSSSSDDSLYISLTASVQRPFYVLVDQILIANTPNCLHLNEGDIFLVTKYNKIGYWWGISVYDLNVQGWFPSTFVQPYTGDVPPEARSFYSTLIKNTKMIDSPQKMESSSEIAVAPKDRETEFNIVADTGVIFSEYDSTMHVVNRGRTVHAVDHESAVSKEPLYEEEPEFDYEAWEKSKHDERRTNSNSLGKRRKT